MLSKNIALVFWSKTGNTKAMGNYIRDGALSQGAYVATFKAYNFTVDIASAFDKIAFGCPAMGAEVLEETEFQPMYDSVKSSLRGKKVILFGSYSWGNGEWMDKWKKDVLANGIILFREPIVAAEPIDEDVFQRCKALGVAFADA